MNAAPAWLLLRGLTREAGHWGAFVDQLREALPPGTPVHTIDLPGNGARWRERSPACIGPLMEAARAQALALGVPPPWQLLALSLGGMVAVEWACRHPRELAGALLVGTSLRPFSPWYRRLRPAAWLPLLGVLARGSARARERAILALNSARAPQAAAEVLEDWVALREAHPVSAANALRQLLAAARYRAPRRPPQIPLRLAVGRGDRLVHPGCSHALARAWGVPLAEHPWAGHELALDDGPWLAREAARGFGPGAA